MKHLDSDALVIYESIVCESRPLYVCTAAGQRSTPDTRYGVEHQFRDRREPGPQGAAAALESKSCEPAATTARDIVTALSHKRIHSDHGDE